ncbi:hypothetical protein [Streptomyces sp. NPDC001914]
MRLTSQQRIGDEDDRDVTADEVAADSGISRTILYQELSEAKESA